MRTLALLALRRVDRILEIRNAPLVLFVAGIELKRSLAALHSLG